MESQYGNYISRQDIANANIGNGKPTLGQCIRVVWIRFLNFRHFLYFVCWQEQKKKVSSLEQRVTTAKKVYSSALRNLEQISDEIHMQRRTQSMKLGERGSGVGAESSPEVPPEQSPGLTRPTLLFTDTEDAKIELLKGFVEGSSKDDLHLVLQKSPLAKRPLSLQDEVGLTVPEDPHSILMAYESTDHLDEMSDAGSLASEVSRDDDFNDRGLLGLPGGASAGSSRASSQNVSPLASKDVSPAMSRESSQNSCEDMAREAERMELEGRKETEDGQDAAVKSDGHDIARQSGTASTDLTPVIDDKQIHLELDTDPSAESEQDAATPTGPHPSVVKSQDAEDMACEETEDTLKEETEDTLTEETQTDERELDGAVESEQLPKD